MKKFTNENIRKEWKRLKRNLLIYVIILIVGIALGYWGYHEVEMAHENAKTLTEIIVDESEEKENKIATLEVDYVPYQFAVQEGNENSFYICVNDGYMYIAYLPPYIFSQLNVEDINENPITIEGTTKLTTREVKNLAIEAYNEIVEDEYKITIADFDDYFGTVYLDATVTGDDDIAVFQELGFFIFSSIGIVGIIICSVQAVKFNRSVKKMDEDLIEKLDQEMNDSSAFYYEKIHLYLTKNYIINFQGTFKVIEYKDIIWMYTMTYRTNWIKTNQSIKVMIKNGKTYEIASINVISKAQKQIYEEIWNTIISKNGTILLGYTKENQKEAKEMIEK